MGSFRSRRGWLRPATSISCCEVASREFFTRGSSREVRPSPTGSSAAAPVLRLDRPIALLPPARHRRGPMPTPLRAVGGAGFE
jgi:hypothetical protein